MFPFRKSKSRERFFVSILPRFYLGVFLASLQGFVAVYVMSNFLSGFVSEVGVGLLYFSAALTGLFALFFIPHLLKRIGNLYTILILASIGVFAHLALAFGDSLWFILPAFLIYQLNATLLVYTLDMLLERITPSEEITGSVRGITLTIVNTALVLSPFIAGFVLGEQENYQSLFLLSALILSVFTMFMAYTFKRSEDPAYTLLTLKEVRSVFKNHSSLSYVFIAQIILRIFYAWMVIYTPIYLHQHIGIPWDTLGIIFGIMLLPFVLLTLPAGKIADHILGEKEMMMLGFFIAGSATALISFHETANPVFWILLLLLTRVGAALVEITTESYFFKQVGGQDSSVVSIFRSAIPLSFVLATGIASIFIFFFSIQLSFLVLAGILFLGIGVSALLVDTK